MMMMMMMMNSVPSNWKRRSQLSFPWVITITLLTRLHLRPIMHIAHPESVEDTISFIIVIIAKKNVSLDYERGLHTFYLINSLSSSEGKGAKETIVEILTESQKMNTKSDSKVPPSAFSANLKMSVFMISYYEIQDGIFPLSHSWPIHLRSLVGDGAIVCRSPCVAKSLSPEYSWWISIDREDWRYHCEIIFLTIRNDLLQGHDKNRNDFIKMTILSWIGHLSGCRKTPRDWYF